VSPAATVASGLPMIAHVVVIPPIAGNELLAYSVPPSLAPRVREGVRVLVPLGARQVTGIVLEPGGHVPKVRLRDVLDVLDEAPLLSPELLGLCKFAASYYMTTLGEVLSTAVLAGLRAESHRTVRLVSMPNGAQLAGLGKTEREVVERLGPERSVRVSALVRASRASRFYAALRSLATAGWIAVDEHRARSAASVRYETVWRLARPATSDEQKQLQSRAKAQWLALERVVGAGQNGLRTSGAGTDLRVTALRGLAARGLVRADRVETYRRVAPPTTGSPPPFAPNVDQQQAIDAVGAVIDTTHFQTFLLQGVTGSGKTEVYLQAAARALHLGRGALILVPEIALTHDLVERVCARFGDAVAVLHSGLSDGERFDEWRRLARREARIAVGVRSAVFAPVADLGLIVVDEEHDASYKQDEGLRYNARDLAIVRARDCRCPAVLGSATPSIESHYNAQSGRYRLLELHERVERRPLPHVDLVDLKVERPQGTPPVFALRVAEAIHANFSAGAQTLLFLNRRGYAHYLQCTLCGYVMGCPNCSVTLTFHLRSRRVRCHHCDHSLPAPDLCPQCSSPHLRDFGIGTEQVESVVRELIPRARVARMDRDTMARKGALRTLLRDWNAGRLDVLVGTQMVTKGHDVPGVTLVGVVAPDQTLNFPDFRAAERTFQVLTQVAGRAGRGDQPGRVLVQTYRPSHYAVRCAVAHDFAAFASEELRYRAALGYPPYSKLANLRFDGLDALGVEQSAHGAAATLRERNETLPRVRQARILGPAPAPIERLRGRFRWQILVKAKSAGDLHALLRPLVERADRGRDGAVRLLVDVDPYGML
jgi:primosomal protein N' (replication factor Y)